jgi:MFS family permease
MFWSAFSEIKGRRAPYIISILLYVASTAAAAKSNDINTFIALRCLQAIGSSAVLALGAGTLADIYDVHERGTKLGIYYISPALG